MTSEAQKRWDWINGVITAALNTAFIDNGIEIRNGLTFLDAIEKYRSSLKKRLSALKWEKPLPDIYLPSQDELHYLFHLEAELWGPDWKRYLRFFPKPGDDQNMVWETFRFVLAFFLVERWLNVFIPPNRRKASRRRRRRCLLGCKEGVLTVKYPKSLDLLGLPFGLCANTNNITVAECLQERWQRVITTPVPALLVQFYKVTTRKPSPAEILKVAFVRSRKDLPKRLRLKGQAPKETRSWWYDVLWKYSESVRYNPLTTAHMTEKKPFYWNRSIRWLTSFLITGLRFVAIEKSKGTSTINIADTWMREREKNHILGGIYASCNEV